MLNIYNITDTTISCFLNPKEKMLFDFNGIKLLCEYLPGSDESELLTFKILCLFSEHVSQFADRMRSYLDGRGNGKIEELRNYEDVKMAFIVFKKSKLDREFIDAIYLNLKIVAVHITPVVRENEEALIKNMIFRGLLISYEDGNISDYTLKEWMKPIIIG